MTTYTARRRDGSGDEATGRTPAGAAARLFGRRRASACYITGAGLTEDGGTVTVARRDGRTLGGAVIYWTETGK